jgi:hypothetical protein
VGRASGEVPFLQNRDTRLQATSSAALSPTTPPSAAILKLWVQPYSGAISSGFRSCWRVVRDVWWSTVLIPSIGRGRLCGSWLLIQGRVVFANSGAQGHATLGAVDVCLLLKCSNRSSDIDELVRRVIARGRESASVAENRVRKHFSDSVRSWDIVANLPQWLRGAVVEVNGMQVNQLVLSA